MANADRPHGFNFYGPLLRLRPYTVAVANTTVIFKQDIIGGVNTGTVAPAASAGIVNIGATPSYLASVTAGTILVSDDQSQLYEAQDDAVGTPAQSYIFNSMDMYAGTGNANTKISGHELEASTLDAANGLFVLMDIVTREDNEVLDNADWVCMFGIGEALYTVAAGV